MFVQVIDARVADAGGFARQLDRWRRELQPGATGFVGSTAGITDDGRVIVLARFDSAESARANSERPEQGAWWSDVEATLDGPARFSESTDVELFGGGGTNDAGFVQVMLGRGGDRDRLQALDEAFETVAKELRPDLLGGYRAWTGPGAYVEVAYFTSESEARAGEQAGLPEQFSDLSAAMGEVEYLDLRHPTFA